MYEVYDIMGTVFKIAIFVILAIFGFIWGWSKVKGKKQKEEPEYASDTEVEDIVIKTMGQLPDLFDKMKSAKETGDNEWINKYLENEKNISYLKGELERYGDALFDTEDVVKYLQWFYAEKV